MFSQYCLLRLCDSINVEEPNDISNLFENLADGIASVVQYNKDNRESTTRNITIDTICDIMTSQKKSVVSFNNEWCFHHLV